MSYQIVYSPIVFYDGSYPDLLAVRLQFTETVYDGPSENYSTLSLTSMGIKCGHRAGRFYFNGNIKVNGETIWTGDSNAHQAYSGGSVGIWLDELYGSYPRTTSKIYHNSDGNKTISITANINGSNRESGFSYNCNLSTSVNLAFIPRASGVSATNANITEQSTIVITRYSNDFTHELTWTFGNLYGTITSNTSSTSINWTLPESLYTQIPNAKSGTGTITCTTKYGSTIIGTSSCQFRATAKPELCKPTINPTIKDISPETTYLTGNPDVLVKYHSDVEINIGASARYSSTLTAVNCACGAKSIGTMTGTINDVETGLFSFSATDSRDYTTATGVTKQMIDYVRITANLEVPNPTTYGETTLTITGNYFNGSFGNVNNLLVVLYRIKENNEEYGEWQVASPTLKNNTYKAVINITGLNYLNSYTFQVRAYDMLETVTSKEVKVKTIPVFDWSENDFNFNVPVTFSAGYTINEASLTSDAYNANDLMSHKLMGAINALTNNYALETTYTTGSNYSSATGTESYLIGNNLRCYFNATRSSATSTGNIANEVVCSIKVKHSGKIATAFNISVPNGATGGLASFSTTNMENDGTYLTFDISLAAVDIASTQFSTYFTIPVTLNLNAYV